MQKFIFVWNEQETKLMFALVGGNVIKMSESWPPSVGGLTYIQ